MNLAETNKEAACLAYTEKYGSTPCSFSDRFYHNKKEAGYIFNKNNQTIAIESSDFLSKFLSNFGHLVEEFRLDLDQKSSKFGWTNAFELIATFCSSIKILHLTNNFDGDFIDFAVQSTTRVKEMARNPLRLNMACPTLQELQAENVYFEPNLQLNVCFPNLRSLNLLAIAASDPSFIEVNLPKLEHMGVTSSDEDEYGECLSDDDEGDNDDASYRLDRTNIGNMFKLNPQLKSVYLEIQLDISFVNLINETLVDLQKIDWMLWSDDFEKYRGADIVFKNVTLACFDRIDLNERPPPIAFTSLKSLNASIENGASTAFIDYIKKNQSLKSLNLSCEYNEEQVTQLIQALPDLQDLNLTVSKKMWSANGMIRFLTECEKLTDVLIMCNVDSSKQKSWRSSVAGCWKISNDYDDFCCIRKGGSNH